VRAIAVGGGDVGAYLCRRLVERGDAVTLLEIDPLVAQRLDRELSVPVRLANGSSAQVLQENHVEEMDYFFAITHDDRVNLLASSIAKRMGASCAVARIHDNTYADYSYLNYQSHFDIDLFVNPEALAAAEIGRAIRNPGRVAVELFGRGEIEVQQMRIGQHSPLVGKTLAQLHLPDRLRIAYITAGGIPRIPDRDTPIEPHAILTMVGHPSLLAKLRRRINPEAAESRCNVAVFGATETGSALLKAFDDPRYCVKIFDGDSALCQSLAARYPRVSVICGRGTSLRLMQEENIGDCEHFIAVSRNDEENIMACLQARKLGARATHLVLNTGDYEEVVADLRGDLGLRTATSPRVAIAEELLRFMRSEAVMELDSLPNRAANFYEVRIDVHSASHNRLISELHLPDGCLIVALQHKFRTKVPCAQDRIIAGDRLILIAAPAQFAACTAALL
jgi:trk system potassium uptake protein TrkA